MPFTPLHVYSGYSFLKSGLTIDKIAKATKDLGYYGCGLSDVNVMHGIPEFVSQMEDIKKPFIVGMEADINGYKLCLYALDESGYRLLSKLSTDLSHNEDIEKTLKLSHSGLLGILTTNEGSFKTSFQDEDVNFNKTISGLSKLVDYFYLGLEITDEDEKTFANRIRKFAVNHHYLCVAFPKILYVKKDDAIVLEIVTAIANDNQITDKKKTGNYYFMEIGEYEKLYEKSEIQLSSEIVDKSKLNFHAKRGEMLKFPVDNVEETLKGLCFEALKNRQLDKNEEYQKRLEKELTIIKDMGYCDYFLIVSDYVSFAKRNGILVGPGRGSAAGSLVSYLLDITTVDPIKYDLLFERFLNPARKTMPDIDIDFMDTRRDEIVQYLRTKYGINKVANIVTFSTILARQSIRDIGRIYNYENRDIDLLAERLLDRNLSLKDSYRQLPAFKSLIDSDKYYLEIISLASKIENLPRQTGMHAAGVVLNNNPIDEAMPVTIDFQGNYISQYEMNYLEEQGFLKMDLLGLRNLTTISNCVDLINAHHKDANLDKFNLPFDEKDAIELIASTRTMGIFQLESSGMKRAIKVLKPTSFEDIVALVALFRPGPLQYIETYARRKNGLEQFNYFSDDLKEILEPTYGIIVYQEQIIKIVTKMAGFSLENADIFRKAVSKKNIDELKSQEKTFLEGSLRNGYSEKVSLEVFEMIMKFANYGLNKSHSACYAMIACQMAHLKAKYPLEFYASILETSTSTNDSKFSDYVTEMKTMGIEILPPSINHSSQVFIANDKGLLFPLSSIKGVSGPMIQTILLERKKGEFKDIFDFVSRLFPYKITENQVSRLIDSGAFDEINKSRASLLATLPSAFQYANVTYKEDGTLNLDIGTLPKPRQAVVFDDPLENLAKEMETIGIMLSSNPLRYKKDLLESKNVISLSEAPKTKGVFNVAGIIKNVKTIKTKTGTLMAFVKIFDEHGEIDITVFPSIFTKCIDSLKRNKIIVAKVKSEKREEDINYVAFDISPLEE